MQTTIPPNTKGIAMSVTARAVQASSFSGSTGMYNWTAKQTALVSAKAKVRELAEEILYQDAASASRP